MIEAEQFVGVRASVLRVLVLFALVGAGALLTIAYAAGAFVAEWALSGRL